MDRELYRGSGVDERDNLRRWDGARRGHYEVWYVTLNHRPSQTGYWIRYTMESPLEGHGEPYAQLWFACFDGADAANTFAINKKFPIDAMRATAQPFSICIGDAKLAHDSARGALSGDGHDVAWDLAWIPAAETHHHLPKVMYDKGGRGDTTVLSPNLNVSLRGTIRVDGKTFELDGEPGGQTHLWGRKHAHSWAWGHCNAFENHPEAALETLTVRLKKRGRVLPPMTVTCLYLNGREYRFTEFHHTLLNRGQYGTGTYTFRARNRRTWIEGVYTCAPEDMVVATYEDPDGELSYCANTEVADLTVSVFERSGFRGRWRRVAELNAPKAGHFEVGGRERDPAVVKDHVTVAGD